MTLHWRPRLLWIPMGGMLGVFSGATVGIALLLATLLVDAGFAGHWWEAVAAAITLGGIFGGLAGGVVGLAVGLALSALVGAHLPRDRARRRARVLGHLLPPLALLAPLLPGALASGFGSDVWFVAAVLAGGSLLGGPLASWAAGLLPERTTGP